MNAARRELSIYGVFGKIWKKWGGLMIENFWLQKKRRFLKKIDENQHWDFFGLRPSVKFSKSRVYNRST